MHPRGAALLLWLAAAAVAHPTSRRSRRPAAGPPGGFTKYSWDTLSTFCFPGGTGDAGWGPHNQSAFTAEQIELYTKFDFIMIAMLNQTAKQVPCPGPMECDFVPQGTAMSVQQAAAIKAAKKEAIVFAYITGYLAQSTFEGGAKLAAKDPSWWLADSTGVPLDNNWTAAHPTNCHCAGYTQSAPGPMWDWRQQRVRDFFMDEMVAPMVLGAQSKHVVDGIFFDDALDIPNYCATPPHGAPPCTGNFTFTPADQAALGAATLAHWDTILGRMAAEDKGTVMSMNPVTSTSYPINSTAGDGMLQRHGAFHFFEFFCHVGAPSDVSGVIALGLSLAERGVPFLAHAGLMISNSTFHDREYCLAAYLTIASKWSYYGLSHSWTADSFSWFAEFDRPLGKPLGRAKPGRKAGQWSRAFEHVDVAIDTGALTASVEWRSA